MTSIDRIAAVAKKYGVDVDEEIIDSPSMIVSIICDYAYQNSINLIVVGNRGLNAFENSLTGSVSQGIVQSATCPVLVVK